jgi:transposase
MARGKKHTAEQIVNRLRQVEVGVGNGKTLPQACKDAGIVQQTYYRWCKKYGALKGDQARRRYPRWNSSFAAPAPYRGFRSCPGPRRKLE